MKYLLTILLLVPLSGCGGMGASDADKDAAMHAVIDCMRARVDQLDDHRSDATSIAYALVSACNAELERSIQIWEPSLMLNTERERYARQTREGALGAATQIVLAERNRR